MLYLLCCKSIQGNRSDATVHELLSCQDMKVLQTKHFDCQKTKFYTLGPHLTFIVGTLIQSSQCKNLIKSTGAVRLCKNGPECRCNVRDSPTRV